MTDWDIIEMMARRLEMNVRLCKKNSRHGYEENAKDGKFAAHENIRILQYLDDEVGEAAAKYGRENGL